MSLFPRVAACIVGFGVWLTASAACCKSLPDFAISVSQVQTMREAPLPITTIDLSGTPQRVSCRMLDLAPPGGRTFAGYIQDALNGELSLAAPSPAPAGRVLKATLTDVQLNCGWSQGTWTFTLQLEGPGGAPIPIQVTHKFPGNYIGETVVASANDAFVPAVQDVLDAILKSAAPSATQIASASAPDIAPTVARSPVATPAPTNAPSSGADYASKRLTVAVVQKCANNASLATFLLDMNDDDCAPATLAAIRGKVVSVLAGKGMFASVGEGDGDLVLTVTLTKKGIDSGPLGDITAKYRMIADYALTDAAGDALASGTVTLDAGGFDSDAIFEQHFAEKLAATLMAQVPAGGGAQQTPFEQQAMAAANAAYDDLVAKAYRSLPTKPPLPDEARAAKLKAETALQSGDTVGAAKAYLAALKSAFWWPEGHRELALLLAKLGKPADAIFDMNMYLALAPDASDAAQMRADIADWSRLAPPPAPIPSGFAVPPGVAGLGIETVDTPSIVALADNRPDLEGALVVLVLGGSPAEKAGLTQGDVIVDLNGRPLASAQALVTFIKGLTPGTVVQLMVVRGQQQLPLTVQY